MSLFKTYGNVYNKGGFALVIVQGAEGAICKIPHSTVN